MSKPDGRESARMNRHLEADEVARFVDRRSDVQEREAIVAHLAQCPLCRQEVTAVRRIVRRRAARRGLAWGIPAAVAAALVLLTLGTPVSQPDSSRLRADPGSAALVVVMPAEGAVVTDDSVVFVWSDEAGRGPYALTVSDSVGQTVFSLATESSRAAVLASDLARGARYLWYVDGLARDDTRATTGIHSFTVAW